MKAGNLVMKAIDFITFQLLIKILTN